MAGSDTRGRVMIYCHRNLTNRCTTFTPSIYIYQYIYSAIDLLPTHSASIYQYIYSTIYILPTHPASIYQYTYILYNRYTTYTPSIYTHGSSCCSVNFYKLFNMHKYNDILKKSLLLVYMYYKIDILPIYHPSW